MQFVECICNASQASALNDMILTTIQLMLFNGPIQTSISLFSSFVYYRFDR